MVMMFRYVLVWGFHELSVVKMVNGMVTLQELYGTMGNNIQKNILVCGKYLWEATDISFNILFMWNYGSLDENP